MIDADIVKLSERESSARLDGLATRIWAEVAERAAVRKRVRFVAVLQVAVLALAMIGSISAGLLLAPVAPPSQVANLTAPGIEFTPSQLLLGAR